MVKMPYKRLADLPPQVKRNLPAEAQKIYEEAFNSAAEEYKDASKRRGTASAEETAHKVAWAAVKRKFDRDNQGDWKKKSKNASLKSQKKTAASAKSHGKSATR